MNLIFPQEKTNILASPLILQIIKKYFHMDYSCVITEIKEYSLEEYSK